jgi:ATP-dependent exoDNAse (exonuclease V) beta subunit
VEGRPDAEREAVSLITMHAAKGLEWSIVIPINMTGTPRPESDLVQDRRSNRFSIPVFGFDPTGYADLRSWSELELARERVRLLYVATTRARSPRCAEAYRHPTGEMEPTKPREYRRRPETAYQWSIGYLSLPETAVCSPTDPTW